MPNNDYILRSDAVFAVQKRIEQISMGNNPYVCSIRQAVRDAPAADVEPKRKTGRWIDLDDHLLCSSCGASHTGPDKNYCPNCGAKMDAEPPTVTHNDIPPEMIEAAERNEKRINERVDKLYEELIAEKRAEIERLKAEIAKMPPLDYDKLAKNQPLYPVCIGFKCWDGKEEDNADTEI